MLLLSIVLTISLNGVDNEHNNKNVTSKYLSSTFALLVTECVDFHN